MSDCSVYWFAQSMNWVSYKAASAWTYVAFMTNDIATYLGSTLSAWGLG